MSCGWPPRKQTTDSSPAALLSFTTKWVTGHDIVYRCAINSTFHLMKFPRQAPFSCLRNPELRRRRDPIMNIEAPSAYFTTCDLLRLQLDNNTLPFFYLFIFWGMRTECADDFVRDKEVNKKIRLDVCLYKGRGNGESFSAISSPRSHLSELNLPLEDRCDPTAQPRTQSGSNAVTRHIFYLWNYLPGLQSSI